MALSGGGGALARLAATLRCGQTSGDADDAEDAVKEEGSPTLTRNAQSKLRHCSRQTTAGENRVLLVVKGTGVISTAAGSLARP